MTLRSFSILGCILLCSGLTIALAASSRPQQNPRHTREGTAESAPKTEPAAADTPKSPATIPETRRKPPVTLTESCTSGNCHADFTQGAHVHGPASLGMCNTCHVAVTDGMHGFRLARQGQDLCLFCHDSMEHKSVVHGPVASGQCSVCHDPHRSEHRYMLKHPPEELCLQCHDETRLRGKSHVHAPVVAGQCTLCHDPHSSDQPQMLVRPQLELCYSCHTETQHRFLEQTHWHKPVQEQCTLCHNPHTSDPPKQLEQAVPELCWSCHSDLRDHFGRSSNIHKAVEMKDKCLNCHDPHASQQPKLLKQDLLSTCLSCHDQEIDVGGRRPLLNMKKELDESKFLHGPIKQGNCVACHRPHAASTFRRLVDVFPPDFYAPFDLEQYGLCFGCHDKQLVLTADASGLTGFRDGNRNLHHLHVNKDKKGRTCRACHSIHGSNNPFHIRDTVPFGAWEIPLTFQKSDDGGSCSPGCHAPKTYSRSRVNND